MLHFRGSIRDLDIGGNCQSQKSCNFDHFFVSRLPAALEQCRGGETDPARYCERRGAWQHGVAQVRRCGSIRARRHGAAQVQRCEKGRVRCGGTMRTRHHGAARVQWCGKGASAALWGGAGVVLGANAALRHGIARIRRCGVRPLWRHREVRGAVEAVFRFGCQNGQIAKSFQNFIGKTHLKKIFLDGAGTAKYFIKLCLFAKQPVATKEEMTRGSV